MEERVQPLERIVIAPLQIVDHQQERSGCSREGRVQSIVEIAALPTVGESHWVADRLFIDKSFGQDACDFGALRRRELRPGSSQRIGSEPFGYRSVGEFSFGSIAVGPRDARTPLPAPL